MDRALILLSPYRLPGQHSLSLGDEESAAFLNGYSALWHPAALAGAAGPPKIESAYDHENPVAGRIFAVPDSPPLFLPDDWDQRVEHAGAVSFKATADREATFANLIEALKKQADKPFSRDPQGSADSSESSPSPSPKRPSDVPWDEPDDDNEEPPQSDAEQSPPTTHHSPPLHTPPALLDLPRERITPFLGVGLGYLVVMTLFEAMEHENLLAAEDLWQDIQQAVKAVGAGDADACQSHLRTAVERLNDARNVLYPVPIYIVDLGFLEANRLDEPLPAAVDRGQPFNLIASVSLLERLAKEQPERFATLRGLVQEEKLEVCSGDYLEREDTLLPLESQLWNLVKGQQVYHDLIGKDVSVFGRKRFGQHPQLPMLLQNVNIGRALLVPFDNGVLPSHRTAAIYWPSPDGKQVEAFTRVPHDAASPQTFFHLAHYLHKTIQQDQTATLALIHKGKPAAPWYDDWLALTQLGSGARPVDHADEVLPRVAGHRLRHGRGRRRFPVRLPGRADDVAFVPAGQSFRPPPAVAAPARHGLEPGRHLSRPGRQERHDRPRRPVEGHRRAPGARATRSARSWRPSRSKPPRRWPSACRRNRRTTSPAT